MQTKELLALKETLVTQCQNQLKQRLGDLENELNELLKSIAEETKSSAGDKYETAREMIQQEREKLTARQKETSEHLQFLLNIPQQTNDNIRFGTLVKCNTGIFFLAASIGRIKIDQHNCFVISMQSPLGKLLNGKGKKDQITMNGKTIEVIDFC